MTQTSNEGKVFYVTTTNNGMKCPACGYSYGLTGDDVYLFRSGYPIHCPSCKAILRRA